MKKNLIFFIGGVAVLGAGAYFFLRKKKTSENLKAEAQSEVKVTPEPELKGTEIVKDVPINIDEKIKLEQAEAIVKKNYNFLNLEVKSVFQRASQNAKKTAMLNQLKKLGYTYKDGLLTKI